MTDGSVWHRFACLLNRTIVRFRGRKTGFARFRPVYFFLLRSMGKGKRPQKSTESPKAEVLPQKARERKEGRIKNAKFKIQNCRMGQGGVAAAEIGFMSPAVIFKKGLERAFSCFTLLNITLARASSPQGFGESGSEAIV